MSERIFFPRQSLRGNFRMWRSGRQEGKRQEKVHFQVLTENIHAHTHTHTSFCVSVCDSLSFASRSLVLSPSLYVCHFHVLMQPLLQICLCIHTHTHMPASPTPTRTRARSHACSIISLDRITHVRTSSPSPPPSLPLPPPHHPQQAQTGPTVRVTEAEIGYWLPRPTARTGPNRNADVYFLSRNIFLIESNNGRGIFFSCSLYFSFLL